MVNKIESTCISALQWISGVIYGPSRRPEAESPAFHPWEAVTLLSSLWHYVSALSELSRQ